MSDLSLLQTLPSKRKDVHASQTETGPDEAEPASVTELLSMPAMRALTISGFALSFLSLAFDVVFTLFCYTPIGAGGLGLEVSCRVQVHCVRAGPHHLPTALNDRKRLRIRGDTRRLPPVLCHAVHLATF